MDSYLEAIDSKYLTIKKYSPDNFEHHIDQFLGFSQLELGKKRFNVVLGNKEDYYLESVKANRGISRSQTIREGLKNLMEKDEKYQKSLAENLEIKEP